MRTHLLLLVLCVLLPTLAFSGLAVWRFAGAERARMVTEAQDSAREVAAALDREFLRDLTTVRTLALLESLDAVDLAGFHRRAQAMARDIDAVVTLRDVDSRQILNTSLPWGAALPAGTGLAREDAEAARTGQPVFSDTYRGVVSGNLFFAVVVPLADRGPGTPRFLSLSVPVGRVQRILAETVTLAPGVVAGVVDRRGRVVARSHDAARWVGEPSVNLPEGPIADSGTAYTRNREGADVLLVYRWSQVAQWRVGVGVPRTVLDAPVREALWALAAIGTGALGFALLAALWVGGRLTASMQALAAAGLALGRDGIVPPVSTPLREANAVGAALADAAADIAAREAARQADASALHRADERFRVALLSAPVTAMGCDRALRTTWIANPRGELAADEVIGRRDDEVAGLSAAPEEIAALMALKREVVEGGQGARRDLTWTGRDGVVRHYDVVAEPLRDDATGALTGATIAALDVTARVAALETLREQERRQRLLIDELNHRVKNTLASVQSIAAQTLRAAVTPEEARVRLQARLLALASAHDVLTRESWDGALLSEVLERAVAPHRPPETGRLTVEGPPVWLSPRAALAFSLAFHELATNAVKHGALGTLPEGRVVVRWTLSAERVLELTWTETGGPAVPGPPERRGFGMRLIERGLSQDLGGRASVEFAPGGIICTVTAQLPAVPGSEGALLEPMAV